jgi:hypothetical protein
LLNCVFCFTGIYPLFEGHSGVMDASGLGDLPAPVPSSRVV